MASETINRQRERNFKAALAQFVQEHLPVPDPHADAMNDLAWQIADRLQGQFFSEFAKVQESEPSRG